ncbi:MAG: Creatinine amidohydrolase, partial [uncultured Ramlibacter sp.]
DARLHPAPPLPALPDLDRDRRAARPREHRDRAAGRCHRAARAAPALLGGQRDIRGRDGEGARETAQRGARLRPGTHHLRQVRRAPALPGHDDPDRADAAVGHHRDRRVGLPRGLSQAAAGQRAWRTTAGSGDGSARTARAPRRLCDRALPRVAPGQFVGQVHLRPGKAPGDARGPFRDRADAGAGARHRAHGSRGRELPAGVPQQAAVRRRPAGVRMDRAGLRPQRRHRRPARCHPRAGPGHPGHAVGQLGAGHHRPVPDALGRARSRFLGARPPAGPHRESQVADQGPV